MKLSIIIPVFNGEKCLKTCIDSIEYEKQYKDEIEVIIVDDGSVDNTYSVSDELANKYDNVKVFHKENGGVSSARNFGLSVSQGEYVLFVDADDTLKSTAISSVMTELQKNEADYYIFPIEKEIKKGTFEKQNYSATGSTIPTDEAYEYFFADGNNGPWSKLFKVEIIRRNGLHFHEELKIHEDVIFCMEYLERCKTVRYCEDVIYTYVFNAAGAARKHKIEYLDNYSTVYYLWLSYLKRHRLDKYIGKLNCTFLHKMLTTSAKLYKHGIPKKKINKKLKDNKLFYEISQMHFFGLKWKIEKVMLTYRLYPIVSIIVK